ncbi:fimbrial protein, partial [Escherichia coli]|uniref:fimbrial protein n=1 Tax=Escherichia coli TaxID=562 RepID=UPI0021C7B6AC
TDGDGSHGSTSKTPSYTKSVSWHHYPDTTVSIPITASYYVYDTNKVKSGALEATALINVKYD